MIILLSGIFLVGIALAIYAFFPSKQESDKKRADESIPLHVPRETTEPKPGAGHPDSSAELQQLKNEHRTLQTQMELANNVVKSLRADLVKANASAATAEGVEQVKKENAQLKDELLKKSIDLDKLAAQKLDSNKGQEENKGKLETLTKENQQLLEKIKLLEEKAGQLGEQVSKKDYDELNNKFSGVSDKVKTLEGQNTDLTNKIKLLEAQVAEYAKQEAALKATIEDTKKEGEQVPKKDFDDLDKKLNEEISKVEGLQKEKSDAVNKIRLLEMQIEQYKKEIEKVTVVQAQEAKKPVAEDVVPRKEYEEVKKKLAEAEEVLRIVHGAGE